MITALLATVGILVLFGLALHRILFGRWTS